MWLAASVSCLLAAAGSAEAQHILYVDQDATGPVHDGSSWCEAYAELYEALGVATSGDTILVAEGVYLPDRLFSLLTLLLVCLAVVHPAFGRIINVDQDAAKLRSESPMASRSRAATPDVVRRTLTSEISSLMKRSSAATLKATTLAVWTTLRGTKTATTSSSGAIRTRRPSWTALRSPVEMPTDHIRPNVAEGCTTTPGAQR